MRSGLLREPITFQSVIRTEDGGGGFNESWSDAFDDRARIKPIIKDESIQQDRNDDNNMFEVVVRYRDSINRNMRIIWGAHTLTIVGGPANYDEKRKWLKLTVRQE